MLARQPVLSSWGSPLCPPQFVLPQGAQHPRQPTTERGAPGSDTSPWCSFLPMVTRCVMLLKAGFPHSPGMLTVHSDGSTSPVQREDWGPRTSSPSITSLKGGEFSAFCWHSAKVTKTQPQSVSEFCIAPRKEKGSGWRKDGIKSKSGKTKKIWTSCGLESKPPRHGFYLP